MTVELFMRVRLVSVIREFLWSGEQFVDHEASGSVLSWWSFTGCSVSEFAITIIPAIYIELASH